MYVFGGQPKCEAQEKQLQCHGVQVPEPRARVAHDCGTFGHHQTWISENTAPKASDMVQREQQSSNGRNKKISHKFDTYLQMPVEVLELLLQNVFLAQ